MQGLELTQQNMPGANAATWAYAEPTRGEEDGGREHVGYANSARDGSSWTSKSDRM